MENENIPKGYEQKSNNKHTQKSSSSKHAMPRQNVQRKNPQNKPMQRGTGKTTTAKKPMKKKKHTGLKVLLVILLILMVVGIFFTVRSNRLGGGKSGMIAALLGHNEDTLKNLEPIYCLIMGESVSSDSRLTDTMIVCKYDPQKQTASMLSIPRDTFIGKNRETATAYYKINNAYRMGEDPENAVKEVNKLTGLDIKYYVMVNTKALKEVVDAIGGVYFDVPINMYYEDSGQDLYIDLKEGYQLLDGDKAEQVVRFRHNSDNTTYDPSYGIEGYGRMKTQMAFLKAVAQQTLKPENILKIGEFIDIFHKNIKTNITIDDMKDYVPYAVNFSTENLKTATLEGEDDQAGPDMSWFFFPNKKKTEKIVNELFFDNEEDEETNTINTTVNNVIN